MDSQAVNKCANVRLWLHYIVSFAKRCNKLKQHYYLLLPSDWRRRLSCISCKMHVQPRHAQTKPFLSVAADRTVVCETFCWVVPHFSQSKVRSPGKRAGTRVSIKCSDWLNTPLTHGTVWLTWTGLQSVTLVMCDGWWHWWQLESAKCETEPICIL